MFTPIAIAVGLALHSTPNPALTPPAFSNHSSPRVSTAPLRIAVHLVEDVDNVWAFPVVERLVADALQARVELAGFEVVRAANAGSADWNVDLHVVSFDSIRIQVSPALGPPLASSNMVINVKQEPADVARAIALMVVETLAPITAGVTGTAPKPSPSALVELVQTSPPESNAPVDTTHGAWRLVALGGSAITWPSGHLSWGAGVAAHTKVLGVVAGVDLTFFNSEQAKRPDLTLSAQPFVSQIVIGMERSWHPLVIGFFGGPVLRLTTVSAAGSGVKFTRRWLTDDGIGGALDAGVDFGWGMVGLKLAGLRYRRFPRLVADHQTLIDLGSTVVMVSLWCAYHG
jgi:hypothetical protein